MRQKAELVLLLLVACSTGSIVADGPAESCPTTQPIRAEPPKDPNADPFGSGPWYINPERTIWAGWDATRLHQGSNKVLWIRPQGADLKVSGRRLDGEAPRLIAHIPCCYPTGFQASGIEIAKSGCWEIKATAGASSLTFVTQVRPRRESDEAAEQSVSGLPRQAGDVRS